MPAVLFLSLLSILGQDVPAAEVKQPGVFELPFLELRYAALQQETQQLIRAKNYPEAEARCRAAIKLVPHNALAVYNLACALALQDKKDEALTALEQAVDLGFNQTKGIEADADLESLRTDERYKKAVEASKTAKFDPKRGWIYAPEPAEINNAVGTVSDANTAWDGRGGMLRSFFKFGDKPDKPVANGMGEAGDLVNKWFKEGTAAGNHGDLYDNHDTDHANMNYGAFPQLTRIEFSEEAQKRQLHHGLQLAFGYNAPTLGNSSTALTNGPFWRCQGRNALTSGQGPQRLAAQYYSNHLYVYPEHRDYDPGHNGADGKGHGDVLPANTPYIILSQGSSGSDVAFLHAVTLTMAAFQPETKTKLVRAGLLMPTVQMIFRRSNKMVEQPEDYLTGKAHPPVFDSPTLDVVKMVTLAHELTPDQLPPVVQIQMKEENLGELGIDYFDIAARERFFDTPSAIARVMKSAKRERKMLVSAEGSRDLNGQTLKYHWVVLRGDPDLIRIQTKEEGKSAEITVQHHSRRPITAGNAMESSRVDLGVFVSNEKYYSAPAFISLSYLENQQREYDDQGRIKVIDYADPEGAKNYVDPLLDFPKNWRDEYLYSAAGETLGWNRIRGEKKERFTFDGCLATEVDAKDRPLTAKVVRYVAKQAQPNQTPTLEQEVTETVVRYEYAGENDLRGKRQK